MNNLFLRGSVLAFVMGLVTILPSGCVVPGEGYGYGYGYDVNVGIGLGYYEPFGVYYGGWGPGYRVAPYRDGRYRSERGGSPPPHAYRPAPASRSLPSIPSRSRRSSPQ